MFSLERHRIVAQLWDWLPAFRAVAEYRSVHKAAAAVAISPSALSRSVRLLEESIGGEVFVRHSGGLSLTPLGADLLSATRDAMRGIDDVLSSPHAQRVRAHIRVGYTSPVVAALVRDASLAISSEGVSVVMHGRFTVEAANDYLLRGDLDVVFGPPHPHTGEVIEETIGTLQWAIFAPADQHGLSTSIEVKALVVFGDEDHGPEGSTIRFRADSLQAAMEAAVQLQCPTLLPKGFSYPGFEEVLVLPKASPICLLHRRPLAGQKHPTLERLFEIVRAKTPMP